MVVSQDKPEAHTVQHAARLHLAQTKVLPQLLHHVAVPRHRAAALRQQALLLLLKCLRPLLLCVFWLAPCLCRPLPLASERPACIICPVARSALTGTDGVSILSIFIAAGAPVLMSRTADASGARVPPWDLSCTAAAICSAALCSAAALMTLGQGSDRR
eukprot:TRINITY_DN812_c0_g1_i1.p3 TRINITY_DN812_c0_g1~~TRINITY_DN812_c0_g1_i1.p3  ORF type:complete len:159 (+),score=20.79 TRINITY_DN812_c0_g1_i1:1453-1929(+)